MNLKVLILIPLSLMFMACSNVYRNVDHSYSYEDVIQLIDTQMGVGSQSSFQNLANDDSSTVYFATSGDDFGLPENILAINYLDFISPGLLPEEMAVASVFFVDAFDESGNRINELLIYVEDINGTTYRKTYRQTTPGYIDEEDRYVVEVSGGGGSLILSTYDLAPGSVLLSPVIQLDVDLPTGEYLGKISALSGFGGL